jgi:hypothetical protein
MQMVEVNDMILNVLDTFQDIADDSRIIGNLNSQGIFDSSHGAECVYGRSNTTDALGHCPGFAGIAPFENELDPSKHGAGCPGICDDSVFYLDFDA